MGGARATFLGVLLLVGSFVVPAGAVEEERPTDARTEDKPDDVMLYAAANLGLPPQPVSNTGQFDHADVRSVWIGEETEKTFQVGLTLKALPTDASNRFFRSIYFDLGGVDYRVFLGPARGGNANTGNLQIYDDGAKRFRPVMDVETVRDDASKSYVFTLPRDRVTNAHHVPARYHDVLNNVTATTLQPVTILPFVPGGDPTGGSFVTDRAPDSGVGAPFKFVLGRVGGGSLALLCGEPIRVSNGESTTIVYKVDVVNGGAQEEAVQLETREVRPEWSVRVPALLKVPAGATVTFPVILSIPFTHDHGTTATFELRAQSLADAKSWSTVRLGVYWTETPQPAGHHDRMWLHSAPTEVFFDPTGAIGNVYDFRSTWMNPLETDPTSDADDAPVPSYFNNEVATFVFSPQHPPPSGTTWTTEWFFPLSPALLIGLDFDLARAGGVTVKVLHDLPATQAELTASVIHCDPEKHTGGGNCSAIGGFGGWRAWTVLATGKSGPRTVNAQETVQYDVPLAVDAAADLIPYRRGANLGLRFTLVTSLPPSAGAPEPAPQLVLKVGEWRAELVLPLIEYHDPIDQAFEAVGTLRLESLVPFEKPVNPGRTAVFRFLLQNAGSSDEDVRLEVHGENLAWVSLPGDKEFAVPAGGARSVELGVRVPEAAGAGERAELFLVAQSARDPAVVAAIRLRATVVDSPDIPDESGQLSLSSAKDSPGPGALFLVAALAAGVVFVRRRRA